MRRLLTTLAVLAVFVASSFVQAAEPELPDYIKEPYKFMGTTIVLEAISDPTVGGNVAVYDERNADGDILNRIGIFTNDAGEEIFAESLQVTPSDPVTRLVARGYTKVDGKWTFKVRKDLPRK